MIIWPGLRRGVSAMQRLLNSSYFYAPRTSSITQTRGAGTPTITRATVATVTNNDGFLVTALSGELREEWARRVRNLLTFAEDLTNAAWFKNNLTSTTATTVTYAAAKPSQLYQNALGGSVATASTVGTTYVAQVKVSGTAGSKINFYVMNGGASRGSAVQITLSATPTVYSLAYTVTNAEAIYIWLMPDDFLGLTVGTLSQTVTATQWQCEDVTAQTTQTAGEYVSVGAPSAWLGTELVTNGTFDTDTTGWTAANSATLSATGSELTITNAGATYGYAYQALTTVIGAKYILRCVARRGTVATVFLQAGNSAGIGTLVSQNTTSTTNVVLSAEFTATATTTYVTLISDNTNNGTAIFDSVVCKPAYYHGAGVDGVKYFSTDISGAPIPAATTKGALVEAAATQYLGVTGTPATQTTASLGTGTYTLWVEGTGSALASAGTATISGEAAATEGSHNTFTVSGAGTVTVTVTGSLTFFQLENSPYPTQRIDNAGAVGTSATRNKDVLDDQVASNLTAAAGTVAFTWTPSHDPSGTIALCGSYVDVSNYTALLHDATKYIWRKRIAGVNYDAELTAAFANATSAKISLTWGASGINLAVDGTLGTAHANTDDAQLGTRWQWGADGNGGQQAGAAFKELYLTPRTLSDAELQAITV